MHPGKPGGYKVTNRAQRETRHAAHVSGGEPPEEGSMPSSVVMSWDAGQISGLLLVSANRRTAVAGGHIFSKRRSAWRKNGPSMFETMAPSADLCCLVGLCISSGQAEVVGVGNYCCHDCQHKQD